MASDPNPSVTLAGSGVLLHVLNPSGEPIPVQGDADGALETVGGGGGGGTVAQGAAGVASWKVVEDNSAAIKAALEKIPAQGQALAAASMPVVLPLTQATGPLATEAKQPAFGTAGTPSTDVQSMQGVVGGTPMPTSNAVATQADGHSATIGATADADTSLTLVGRLKKVLATLIDGTMKSILRGGAKGGTTAADVTSTASGANHNAIDAALYDASGNRIVLPVDQLAPSFIPVRLTGNGTTFGAIDVQGLNAVGGSSTVKPVAVGGVVATTTTSTTFWTDGNGRIMTVGAAASGSAVTSNPVLTGGSDGTNARSFATNSSGQQVVVGPGTTTPATSVSTVQATNTRTANGAPTELTAATSLTTAATKLLKLELRYTHAGTRYVWIFDKANTTVTAADAAHAPIPIANNDGLMILDLSTVPLNLANGCVVSLSSTEATYTVDATGVYVRGTWQ